MLKSNLDENYPGNESYGLIRDIDMLHNECRMKNIAPHTALIGRKY
jgi:hypothetical protein